MNFLPNEHRFVSKDTTKAVIVAHMQSTLTEPRLSLRERRLAAGLSQQRLAELAGCSFHMITLFDNGYAPAHSRVRAKVLAVLDKLEGGQAAEVA
jgi:predicted transcriptional regulator